MKLEIKNSPKGVRLNIYVAPRASKTEIVGYHGGALKIRLTASPVDGAANTALIAFMARFFNTPKSSISIAGGHKSKRKIVEIEGIDLNRVMTMLEHVPG